MGDVCKYTTFAWQAGSMYTFYLAMNLDRTEFEQFVIGGRNLGPQLIEIWDMPTPTGMAGLIGFPFFQQHALCFDYARLELHIH